MANAVRSYKDLVAWQKSMDLVAAVYRASQGFPKEEIFGLVSQIRRAAVSVPSNIAEGHARTSKKEFQYFLSNARGSLAELETQLTIAYQLAYIDETGINQLLDRLGEVGRILNGLLAALKRSSK
ncbi:MAG: four helix bundle protein [Proteobacteria bacterium]|nr:four helix bundle protein [Pseudomonadota bacterium]MBU4353952.1 four helix bundle protein [Pseudomonadota bacterium]MBU4447963.1 four helix bundle protein [Pseudomonadota bacterium]